MYGNVFEYCQQSYFSYWESLATFGATDVEDTTPVTDNLRLVVRGSAFDALPNTMRSAYRVSSLPSINLFRNGFRIARTLNQSNRN